MKIKQIELKNIACFSHQTVTFAHEEESGLVTVLAGEACSGKSVLLRNIFISLSWFIARLRDPRTAGIVLLDEEIKDQQLKSRSTVTINVSDADQLALDTAEVKWTLYKSRSEPTAAGISSVDLDPLMQLVTAYQQHLKADPKTSLPLLVYYPAERYMTDISAAPKPPVLQNQLATYELSLIQNHILNRFFEWYREQEDIENEQRANVHHYFIPPTDKEPNGDLSAIYRRMSLAQQQFLGHCTRQVNAALSIVLPELSNLRIQRSPKLTFMIDRHGKSIPINQLSQGTRSLLAMTGDIVRRLCCHNPNSINPIQEGRGIILIDEIELHLSTEQQQNILSRLQQAFPNCQLIVTTLSEAVYLGQPKAFCYGLKDGQIRRVETSYQLPGSTNDKDSPEKTFESSYLNQEPLQQIFSLIQNTTDYQTLEQSISRLAATQHPSVVQQLINLLQQGITHAHTATENPLDPSISIAGSQQIATDTEQKPNS